MFTDADHPAVPYPGSRPTCSFVHEDATGWPLTPDPTALSGWLVDGDGPHVDPQVDLDAWLAARDAAPLAERVPVLSYGSNPCPSKLTWLRGAHGLSGPMVVLRARCVGLGAVWAAGRRIVDSQRPATLAALPGVTEWHAVLMATPEQVSALDACEGRGDRYDLAMVATGEVTLADGSRLDRPMAYVGAKPTRWPLLVGGAMVRCADVGQAAAAALPDEAGDDGLEVRVVPGAPAPAEHPDLVFVYGTLQPGASAWHLLAPSVAGEPTRAELAGALFDTGAGYPALRLGGDGTVAGWLVRLRDPAGSMPGLDEYEGPGYARVRVRLTDATTAWTYVWTDPFDGFPALAQPWPSRYPIR